MILSHLTLKTYFESHLVQKNQIYVIKKGNTASRGIYQFKCYVLTIYSLYSSLKLIKFYKINL